MFALEVLFRSRSVLGSSVSMLQTCFPGEICLCFGAMFTNRSECNLLLRQTRYVDVAKEQKETSVTKMNRRGRLEWGKAAGDGAIEGGMMQQLQAPGEANPQTLGLQPLHARGKARGFCRRH